MQRLVSLCTWKKIKRFKSSLGIQIMKGQSGEVFHTCISANFPFSDIGSTERVAGKGSLMENYKKVSPKWLRQFQKRKLRALRGPVSYRGLEVAVRGRSGAITKHHRGGHEKEEEEEEHVDFTFPTFWELLRLRPFKEIKCARRGT